MTAIKDEHSIQETSRRSSHLSLSASKDGAELNSDTDAAYSTGFRLWLLVGASIFGVFLISLDQVSCIVDHLTQNY
jgi:hypothetical protein